MEKVHHHYVKILPEYYREIEIGNKTFEVRYNDRQYKINDMLHLREWLNGNYTGKEILAVITYILDNVDYCQPGYIIMAIKVLSIIKNTNMTKITKDDLLRCPCDDCPFAYSDCVYCKTCKIFERWQLRLMSNPQDIKDD